MTCNASTCQWRHGCLFGCLFCLRSSGMSEVFDGVTLLLIGKTRGHPPHEKMIALPPTVSVESIRKILPLLAAEHWDHLCVNGEPLFGGLYMAVHAQLNSLWNDPTLALCAHPKCRGEQEKNDE